MSSSAAGRKPGPTWYEIRLQGRLDPRWSARFEGMVMTTGHGITVLTGDVADQAALHGLLHRLRDIGLPLLAVTRVETDGAAHTSSRPDTSATGA